MEIVNINVAAESLGGVVEDGEFRAHKHAGVVEFHRNWVSDSCPVLAIETIEIVLSSEVFVQL